MKGSDPAQNKKKDTKATVLVPEPAMPLVMPPVPGPSESRQLFQMARIIRRTQVPPIHACTPYQILAMAARLKTGHNAPQIPKDERLTTGKEIW